MIGIVGGGIAGLAAAYRLQEQGHEVQIFEATEEIGGLAAVYETPGDDIEKFYHHLSKSEETNSRRGSDWATAWSGGSAPTATTSTASPTR